MAIIATAFLSACTKAKHTNSAKPVTQANNTTQPTNTDDKPVTEPIVSPVASLWALNDLQLSYTTDSQSGEAYITVVSDFSKYDERAKVSGQINVKEIQAGQASEIVNKFAGADKAFKMEVTCSSNCLLSDNQVVQVAIYDTEVNDLIISFEVERQNENQDSLTGPDTSWIATFAKYIWGNDHIDNYKSYKKEISETAVVGVELAAHTNQSVKLRNYSDRNTLDVNIALENEKLNYVDYEINVTAKK